MKHDAGGPGTLAILMSAKKKPMEGNEPHDSPEEEAGEGHDEAADEVFDALEAKDREAFRSALKSFVEMCAADYEKE